MSEIRRALSALLARKLLKLQRLKSPFSRHKYTTVLAATRIPVPRSSESTIGVIVRVPANDEHKENDSPRTLIHITSRQGHNKHHEL
jgi:hypothetical protein